VLLLFPRYVCLSRACLGKMMAAFLLRTTAYSSYTKWHRKRYMHECVRWLFSRSHHRHVDLHLVHRRRGAHPSSPWVTRTATKQTTNAVGLCCECCFFSSICVCLSRACLGKEIVFLPEKWCFGCIAKEERVKALFAPPILTDSIDDGDGEGE
jgi:hypothetical protein